MIPYINAKPKVIDDETWTYLVEAYENGLSDREAAVIITKKTQKLVTADDLAKLRKDFPKVDELKNHLEVAQRAEAKLVVSDAIRSGKVKTAQWYLERKASDEFSTKSAMAFEGAVVELSLEDKEKKLNELVEQFSASNGE